MFIWTIWDALEVIALLSLVLVALFIWVGAALQEWKCKHNSGVTETSACDAICVQCGKNLGFIGTWRRSEPQSGDKSPFTTKERQ